MTDSNETERKWGRRKALQLTGGAAAGGISLLAGCSGGGGGYDKTTKNGGGKGTSGSQSESGKNVFTYTAQQVVGTIDPAKYTDNTETIVVQNMYDALVWPQGTKMKPMLAKEWSNNEAADTFTFKLRKNVPFQTGGTLTAEDVKYSMDRMLRINQGYAWLWGMIDPGDTEVVDKHTVRFNLNKSYAPFVSTLLRLPIIDSEAAKKHEKDGDYGKHGDYATAWLSENSAGTGPFKSDNYTRESIWKFSRFNDYWGDFPDNPVDRMQFQIVKESSTVKTMIKAGKADMTHEYLPPSTFKNLGQQSKITVKNDPSVTLFSFHLNNRKKPFDDYNFRKAITHAFDYQTALKEITLGAPKAEGPVPNRLFAHNDTIDYPGYDPQKAKQHLKKSKYGSDTTVKMTYVSGTSLERQMGLLLQQNLKKHLDINLKLNKETWARITSMASKPETTPQMTQIYQAPKTMSPDSILYSMYHSEASGTWMSMSWYHKDKIDNLIEKARTEPDRQKRKQLYKKLQKAIVEDMPTMWVMNQLHRIAFRNRVKKYEYEFFTADQRWDEWSK